MNTHDSPTTWITFAEVEYPDIPEAECPEVPISECVLYSCWELGQEIGEITDGRIDDHEDDEGYYDDWPDDEDEEEDDEDYPPEPPYVTALATL